VDDCGHLRACGLGEDVVQGQQAAAPHGVDAGGIVRVQGVVSNQRARPVSTLTHISTVVFDRGGNVIGGGFTFPRKRSSRTTTARSTSQFPA
jgi:hypothetical protein